MSESHLLRLYFFVFQTSVVSVSVALSSYSTPAAPAIIVTQSENVIFSVFCLLIEEVGWRHARLQLSQNFKYCRKQSHHHSFFSILSLLSGRKEETAGGCDAGRGCGGKEFHNFHGILGSGPGGGGRAGARKNATELMGGLAVLLVQKRACLKLGRKRGRINKKWMTIHLLLIGV